MKDAASGLPHDLALQAGAFRARSKLVIVEISFAEQSGTMQTLEGPVAYAPNDALVTGVNGERWPIPRERFNISYQPVEETEPGKPGKYMKIPREVWAWRADRPLEIALPQGTGNLHAQSGDFIVQYAPGDLAVVKADIFAKIYTPVCQVP